MANIACEMADMYSYGNSDCSLDQMIGIRADPPIQLSYYKRLYWIFIKHHLSLW